MNSVATLNPTGSVPPAPAGPSIRISEKSIELTACSQYGAHFGSNLVWVGLTQKEERRLGFDAAIELGGRPFILQFKASNTVLSRGAYKGCRKFECPHLQLALLQSAFGGRGGVCYYFLPDVGTFADLAAHGCDLLGKSYLVDVASLPSPVSLPGRKSGKHNFYLDAPASKVTMTSEPHRMTAIDAKALGSDSASDRTPFASRLALIERVMFGPVAAGVSSLFRNCALVVVPNAAASA